MSTGKGNAIWAIGGSNIDLLACSFKKLQPQASNPGSVSFAHGGVMRNIVQNLCYLGQKPHFITGVGSDLWGQDIVKSLERVGVKVFPFRKEGLPTGFYAALIEPDGDMNVAVCDNRVAEALPVGYVAEKMPQKDIVDVLIDTNLSVDLIGKLIKFFPKARIFAEAVSPEKVRRLAHHLGSLYFLKCARREAIALCHDDEKATSEELATQLHAMGVNNVIVTEGKQGAYYHNTEDKGHLYAIKPTKIVNTTGCGDALFAGTVLLLNRGTRLRDACLFGLKCAALKIAAPAATTPNLSALAPK